tara:strand:+ start:720 stop:1061 length:342 start_codon:yes stop_codon:yes gene_type:complete
VRYDWIVQFICCANPQASFVALFKTEKKALALFDEAVTIRQKMRDDCLHGVLNFKDDPGSRWCINLVNYSFSMGNTTAMATAAHENSEAQKEIAQKLGADQQIGTTGSKYDVQ